MSRKRILLALAFVAVAAIIAPSAAFAADDKFPNGCVSCHTGDRLIPNMLAQIKGHPNVSKMIKSVPDGCAVCHKPNAKAPELKVAIHTVHKIKAADNAKAADVTGNCLNCHVINAKGAIDIKLGKPNW